MKERHWRGLSYALFAGVGVVIGVTFLDYGLTWDEEVQVLYGYYVLKWYGSFFHDRAALELINNMKLYLYGGFFDSLTHGFTKVAAPLVPWGYYETRHLLNALFGLLGIVGAYRLGAHLVGPRAGAFAALFLTLTPGFYGYQFNNPKDIPFATLFVWSVYYLFRSYNALPRPPHTLLVKLGVAIGLTLGVRVGAILLLIYLTILWTAWLLTHYLGQRASTRPLLMRLLKNVGLSWLLTTLVAWAVMVVWWPWVQLSPLFRPLEALSEMAHFQWRGPVLFEGRFLLSTQLPWSYLPTWLAISLPEFYFVAFGVGAVLAVYFVVHVRNTPAHVERLSKIGLLLFMVGFPILTAIVLHSTLYDGMRHFLFILPCLAVLAGISWAGLWQSTVTPFLKWGIGGLIVLSAGITIVDMVQLHPYQLVYFNRAVAGGLPTAAARFETDYWGLSYKEGVEWLVAHYRPPTQEKVRVANCSEPFLTGYFLEKTADRRQRFVAVEPEDHPHIFLATTRFECHKSREGRALHIVTRQATPLLYVIEVQSPQ